jgi:hypothetical protein
MAPIAEWVTLKCECGGDRFAPIVKLKFKAGGGTTTEPAGHQCTECRAIVDNAYMIRLVERQDKQRQLRELQEELSEAAPVKPGNRAAATA